MIFDDSLGSTSIVIVTYNSLHVIGACLDPIYSESDFEIVVYDNDSVDGTAEHIESVYPNIRLIKGANNLGFAKAVNLAARSTSTENILLLNPDAIIFPETIRKLTIQLWSDDSTAVVAPVLGEEGSNTRTISAGHFPDIRRMFTHASGISSLSHISSKLEGHYLVKKNVGVVVRNVDWVSGGCLMIKKSWWVAIDGLTERWFMYAEDIELCIRVQEAGGLIKLVPALHAIHAVGGSSSDVDGRVNSAWIEHLYDLYCWRLAHGNITPIFWKSIVCLGFISRSATYNMLALAKPSRSVEYRHEARRFQIFFDSLFGRKYDRTVI